MRRGHRQNGSTITTQKYSKRREKGVSGTLSQWEYVVLSLIHFVALSYEYLWSESEVLNDTVAMVLVGVTNLGSGQLEVSH